MQLKPMRSIHSKAFALAMAELTKKDPKAAENGRLREELVMAIVDLAHGGENSPEQLARYGVSRCMDLV